MVTDGEPTAHIERDGRVEFTYPPTRRTIEMTLREVGGAPATGSHQHVHARSVAAADRARPAAHQVNRGRAFYAEPDRLGEYVLVDFVRNRTGRVG